MFLHDERMAAGASVLNGSERHAFKRHINMLRSGAITGNYKRFMEEWNSDQLGHLRWLDLSFLPGVP